MTPESEKYRQDDGCKLGAACVFFSIHANNVPPFGRAGGEGVAAEKKRTLQRDGTQKCDKELPLEQLLSVQKQNDTPPSESRAD